MPDDAIAASGSGLEDRFAGCLLGLALGDALGAPHEGGLLARALWKVLGLGRGNVLRWTDDTQMAVVLARSLTARGRVDPDHLARAWAAEATWTRGYGAGARALLARVRAGEDWRTANRCVFPRGSFGNGAAMRAAPVGLWHHAEPEALATAAAEAAAVTHAHPLGIEGAVLIARATAMALTGPLDLGALRDRSRAPEYRDRLEYAAVPRTRNEVVERLGNSVFAHESAVTAVYAASRFAGFVPMMEFVVSLGGDVDTIGAMAGGIFGAQHGLRALPPDLLARLEEREGIERAARDLFAAWGARRDA